MQAGRANGRQILRVLAWILPWTGVWLWLKRRTGFPDRFGYHNGLHGKAGVFNEYLHSGLLLDHPDRWSLALFGWMWAPLAGFVLYLAGTLLADRRRRRFHDFARPADHRAAER